ncbi:MAG TPA: hypothetical protein VEJ87_00920 [Acidimicrobiales bacterium]|nr:hypothetical protein [Acidimicrobiales bacterium]
MVGPLDYFDQLGKLVDQRWTSAGRTAVLLPEIAAGALCEVPVPDTLTTGSILSLLARGDQLPRQREASDEFGQPPTVMFRGDGLEIQAITWMEGTTSIHQHGFDGAFRVLCGSSLHVPYRFVSGETLAEGHLLAGELVMEHPEILWPGDVRAIVAGHDFIHALFHLERPSVTVVVRNSWSELPYPQYDYRLPGVGIDALSVDDRFAMRMRGLRSLHRLDKTTALDVALDVVASQDLWTGFRVCDDWARGFGDPSGLSALIERLGRRDSALRPLLEPMFAEDLRRGRLLARRGLLRASHHRLLLALIVNLPDRKSIHSAIRQIYPEADPDQLIFGWVRELASPEFRGVSGLHLSEEALAHLPHRSTDGSDGDHLENLAASWKPPPLLEKLFA